jgi:hypothetical protein
MTIQGYSTSQGATAELHLSRRDEWRYVRIEGTRYVTMPSGRSGHIYTVRADARACSCRWYASGHTTCSHMLAVGLADQREAEDLGLASESEIDCHLAGLRADHDATAAALRRRRYESLFPVDEFETATAHTVGGG